MKKLRKWEVMSKQEYADLINTVQMLVRAKQQGRHELARALDALFEIQAKEWGVTERRNREMIGKVKISEIYKGER